MAPASVSQRGTAERFYGMKTFEMSVLRTSPELDTVVLVWVILTRSLSLGIVRKKTGKRHIKIHQPILGVS